MFISCPVDSVMCIEVHITHVPYPVMSRPNLVLLSNRAPDHMTQEQGKVMQTMR